MSSLQTGDVERRLKNEWEVFGPIEWDNWVVGQIYKTIVLLASSGKNIAEMISWLDPHLRLLRPDVVRLQQFRQKNLGSKYGRKTKLSKEAVFWFLNPLLLRLGAEERPLSEYYYNRITGSTECLGRHEGRIPGANVSPQDQKYRYGFWGKILGGEVPANFFLHWNGDDFIVEIQILQEEINEPRVHRLISKFKRFQIKVFQFHFFFLFLNCQEVNDLLKKPREHGNHCWRGLKDEVLLVQFKEIFLRLMADRGVEISNISSCTRRLK